MQSTWRTKAAGGRHQADGRGSRYTTAEPGTQRDSGQMAATTGWHVAASNSTREHQLKASCVLGGLTATARWIDPLVRGAGPMRHPHRHVETIARLEDEFGRTGAATVGPGVFAELRGRDDLAVDLQGHGVVVDLG
jgi:hypothetical protein